MNSAWLPKAALYELLAQAFRQTTREFSGLIQSGEFAEALDELSIRCELNPRAVSKALGILREDDAGGKDPEEYFHELRRSYTRIFIGGYEPVASPFAGIWWAKKRGIPPVHMVNEESLAVAQSMRESGIARSPGKNDPLDAMVAELEFMQYLCARVACSVEGDAGTQPRQDLVEAYRSFYEGHLGWFVHDMGLRLAEQAADPVYEAVGVLLASFPNDPL